MPKTAKEAAKLANDPEAVKTFSKHQELKLEKLELENDKLRLQNEKTIDQIYNDVFDLLKTITLKKVQAAIIETFEKEFVKKGKFSGQHLRILRNVVGARTDFKKGTQIFCIIL